MWAPRRFFRRRTGLEDEGQGTNEVQCGEQVGCEGDEEVPDNAGMSLDEPAKAAGPKNEREILEDHLMDLFWTWCTHIMK